MQMQFQYYRKYATNKVLKECVKDQDVCNLVQSFDRLPILVFYRVTQYGVYTNDQLWESLIFQDHFGLQRQSFESYGEAKNHGQRLFKETVEGDTRRAKKIIRDILGHELDPELFAIEVHVRSLKEKKDWVCSDKADNERIDVWQTCFQDWDNTYHPYDEARECLAWLQIKYDGEHFFTKCVYITRIEIDLNPNAPQL